MSSSDDAREHDVICNRAHPEAAAGWASGKVIVRSVPCSNASYASGFSQPSSKEANPAADILLPKQTKFSLMFNTMLLTHTVYASFKCHGSAARIGVHRGNLAGSQM